MKKIINLSILTLIIDIVSKQLIIRTMVEYESISVIKNFFSITYAKNTGVAFSFLEGKVPLVIVMTSIVIGLILKYVKSIKPNKIESICYGLVLGGAIGNLLDRIIYGYVIDFLDFNLFGYSFPIFNMADTFIVIGIILLFILSFREGRGN